MSDLISRSALIEEAKRHIKLITPIEKDRDMFYHDSGYNCGIAWVELIANKLPTVEAKPVVHCKDCSHWGIGVAGETEHVKSCEYGKYMVGENGYCCYADMRGGKNE